MAKKRKKQEELKAEKDWKPPVFDREEYMRTEISVAKATIFAAALAVPMAAVAMFTLPVGGTGGGLLIGLAGISLLYFLFPLVKVDPKSLKVMHWLGAISTYFFLFLAVWVMLCNPPFNDFASPAIRDVQVSWDGGDNWVVANNTLADKGEVQMPANVTSNTTLLIRAQVTDNVELNEDSVTIQLGAESPVQMLPDQELDNYFQYEFEDPEPLMFFTISASDTNGNDPSSYELDIVL